VPLQHAQPDNAYCAICSALAAGVCASCHAPVCADCVELTSGGATTFAVCTRCACQGSTLARRWLALLWPILIVVAAGVLVLVLASRR
jgi:hypothetical protein